MQSDHKIVVCRIDLAKRYLIWKRPAKDTVTRYMTQDLASNSEVRSKYQEKARDNLVSVDANRDPGDVWGDVVKGLKNAASEVIPAPRHKGPRFTLDPKVVELSTRQRDLRLRLQQPGLSPDIVRKIKTERNKLLNDTHILLRFAAVRLLKSSSKGKSLCVADSTGAHIMNDSAKASAIADWFKKKFTDGTLKEELPPFTGGPRSLQRPVSGVEVEKALRKLNNGRAAGPDGLPAECIKYCASDVAEPISCLVNRMFEEHRNIEDIGQGILIPLTKPGKPRGPPSSLRPVILLNAIRKVISLVTLHRVRHKIEKFVGVSQSGFAQGRSTTDVVWAHRMMQSDARCLRFYLRPDVMRMS